MNPILHYMKRLYAYSGAALTINLLGMVFSSLLESLGILLLIPMISMSGILSVQQASGYDFKILEELRAMPQTLALTLILSLYVLIVFGQNLIQRKITIRNVEIQQIFSRKLRFETYSMLLASRWSFFLQKRKSDLINLLTIELARVISGINLFLQLVTSFLFTLIQIVFAFWLSPAMTLFVLGCGTVLALFSRQYIHQAKVLGSQTSELSQSYLAGITDQLNGIKDIKSNNLEESRLGWLHSLTQGMMHEQMEYIRLRMNSQLVYKISSALLIAGFVFISFQFFHTQGPQLLLVILIFARLWPRFTGIQSNLEQLAATVPAFKALIGLQKECAEAVEQHEAGPAGLSPAP
ncbi:ABC transporter ATP-binding protein, partial [Paenibacillus sepulcri]|nr:ABC transporter ATP-binding protein [Paenibacillus sepulcri]